MFLVPNRSVDILSVASNLAMTDYPEWAAGVTYAVGARIQRYRRVFQNTIAGNIGVDPILVDQSEAAPKWLADGYINAVRCFDGVLSNKLIATRGAAVSAAYQALGVDPSATAVVLDFAVVAGENMLTLFGLDAMRVQIIGISASGRVVFRQATVSSGRYVTNYWQYFTTHLGGYLRILVTNLPLSVSRVLVCLEGASVELGEVTIGKALNIGTTLVDGTGAAHRTASYFEINSFGNAVVVQRPTRRDVTYRVDLTRPMFEKIEGLISDMTGGLVTGIGSLNRQTSVSCGVMGEIEWDESQLDNYTITFTVRGVS